MPWGVELRLCYNSGFVQQATPVRTKLASESGITSGPSTTACQGWLTKATFNFIQHLLPKSHGKESQGCLMCAQLLKQHSVKASQQATSLGLFAS